MHVPACRQHKVISETVWCTWIWVWIQPGDQSSSHGTRDQEHGTTDGKAEKIKSITKVLQTMRIFAKVKESFSLN